MSRYIVLMSRSMAGIFDVIVRPDQFLSFDPDLHKFFSPEEVPHFKGHQRIGHIEYSEYQHTRGRIYCDEFAPFKFLPKEIAETLQAKSIDGAVLLSAARILAFQSDRFSPNSTVYYGNPDENEMRVITQAGLAPKREYTLDQHVEIIQANLQELLSS